MSSANGGRSLAKTFSRSAASVIGRAVAARSAVVDCFKWKVNAGRATRFAYQERGRFGVPVM